MINQSENPNHLLSDDEIVDFIVKGFLVLETGIDDSTNLSIINQLNGLPPPVISRDYEDTHRDESPLIQAEDAIVIDNTLLNHEEQLAIAIKLAKERITKH